MECKFCGSVNVFSNGMAIVGEDRKDEFLSQYLDFEMLTCNDYKGTFTRRITDETQQ